MVSHIDVVVLRHYWSHQSEMPVLVLDIRLLPVDFAIHYCKHCYRNGQQYLGITKSSMHAIYIPSSSTIVAVARFPPAVNEADCPLLFVILALREKVSSSSTKKSPLRVMGQEGVAVAPGPLPAANETVHVIPTKSPPAAAVPSIV